MRLIALEEAFSIPELAERHPELYDLGPIPVKESFKRHVAERLPEFAELRLSDMDEHGVDLQVLSLTAPGLQAVKLPAEEAVAIARFANDHLASVVSEHPRRFAGLAALPLQDPGQAILELRRAVTELGMRGALVNDQTDGHYLDEPQYDLFWSALEELDVPLYLHPGAPPREGWSLVENCTELIGPTFTWGAETGGHALRLLYSGVFDRHPDARLILGHMGEYLPFMTSRLDSRYATLDPGRTIKRRPSEYIGTNILITVSGVHSPAALAGAVLSVGADAILFAVDYPWEDTAAATAAFAAAPLSADDRHKIAHGNAERLLGL